MSIHFHLYRIIKDIEKIRNNSLKINPKENKKNYIWFSNLTNKEIDDFGNKYLYYFY